MSWMYNEIVRSGNSQARVKNFYPETGFIVLHDIKGEIGAGSTIVGDESGTVLTLSQFTISDEFDFGYEPTHWQDALDTLIYDGNGNLIALEQHFTGLLNQDNQTTYLVRVD